MNANLTVQRDKFLEAILTHVAFDGWTKAAIKGAEAAGDIPSGSFIALFPDGRRDLLAHFADWTDRAMLKQLPITPPDDMKIRERVRLAAATRLDVMQEHREAEIRAAQFWTVPHRAPHAGRMVWRTADTIWNWAGDTATDYNRYTKRALLSGVLKSTYIVWLNNPTDKDLAGTKAFLNRRIANVLTIGRFTAKLKSFFPERKATNHA